MPVVRVITAIRRKPQPGAATTPWASLTLSDSSQYAIAIPCTSESPTVPYRVYWLIFFRPCSPSLLSRSSGGTTTVRSWMMMLAEMYGMMPSAKIDNCSIAPPLNMLNIPRKPVVADCMYSIMRSRFTPGTMMNTPIRYTARRLSV